MGVVFLVWENNGESYDDYAEWVSMAFSSQELLDEFMGMDGRAMESFKDLKGLNDRNYENDIQEIEVFDEKWMSMLRDWVGRYEEREAVNAPIRAVELKRIKAEEKKRISKENVEKRKVEKMARKEQEKEREHNRILFENINRQLRELGHGPIRFDRENNNG